MDDSNVFQADRPRLPTDQLLADFALDNFDRDMSRSKANSHLHECNRRRVEDLYAVSSLMCYEGTCDMPAHFGALISCAHGEQADWEIEANSLGDLIDMVGKFADRRHDD